LYCSDIMMGDLVCVKSWSSDDDAGWVSLPSDYGIILEVIEVEHNFVFIDRKIRCYDYKVYWLIKGEVETLPDIIVEKFSDWLGRANEK
jgi:hypothetical protein